MIRKSYFLIKGRKDEKDILISFGGDELGFVRVYELKESHPFKALIKEELRGTMGSDERAGDMEAALSKWINREYGQEPYLIK